MNFHWPQLVLTAILLLGLGGSLYKHGETETKTESFTTTLVAQVVLFGLLYAGGFFG